MEVEYVDLLSPDARAQHAEIVDLIQQQEVPLPLVAINGQLKLAGTAHFYHILPLVQEALAARNPAPAPQWPNS